MHGLVLDDDVITLVQNLFMSNHIDLGRNVRAYRIGNLDPTNGGPWHFVRLKLFKHLRAPRWHRNYSAIVVLTADPNSSSQTLAFS